MRKFNWGIIGAGQIAEKFADGLKVLPNAMLYAVASRSEENAKAFAEKHGFLKSYCNYSDILNDPDVHIIYVATINTLHYGHTIMALNAGKAVLCEKPFAINSSQVSEMTSLSKKKGIFLMEAMWSRFLPSFKKFKEMVDDGVIGKATILKADFGFCTTYNPESRLFSKEKGGGSLLDIGIYPLFLALFLFGYPTEIRTIKNKAETGVDASTVIILKHKNGVLSTLASSFECNLETTATVYGTEGNITLERMFHMPTSIKLTKNGKTSTAFMPDENSNGYNYEAEAVMKCLEQGKTECDEMPHSLSLELMNLIDEIQNI